MTNAVKDIPTIERETLSSRSATPYKEFRASLTPRYHIVWRDILIGYTSLVVISVVIARMATASPLLGIAIGAILYGYAIAAIHLFIHEAGHYNIARDRGLNDLLANIFMGLLIGLDVRDYRVSHFDHHRYLGQTNDPEHSYFSPLNLRFIIESLTGIRVARVLLKGQLGELSLGTDTPSEGWRHRKTTGLAVVVHTCFLAILVKLGYWPVAVAWILGLLVFFPFFASVRQILEHRDEDADPSLDYKDTPHSPVNRLFGNGLLASTFGTAGFNRHLLHHLEPQVSYTRLKELEQFLRDTEYGPVLKARSTTYLRTFRRLFAA